MRTRTVTWLIVQALIFTPILASATPSGFPDKLELLRLLRERKFEALHTRLSDHQTGYETRRQEEELVVFAFSAFENSDFALEPVLTEWVKRMPESYVAWVARGIYYSYLGWLSRGYRFASETSEEQASGMANYFRKAGPDFRRALSINPRLSVAYGYLLDLATATGDRQASAAIMKTALAQDPYSFLVRRLYAKSLQPKWGGSLDELRAFLDTTRQYRSGNPDLKLFDGYVDYTIADALRDERRKAIDFLNRALQAGAYWQFLLRRGINYLFLGEYEKALADVNLALGFWPQERETIYWRGVTHQKMGHLDEALADLNFAVQLDPLEPQLLRARASVLRDRGRFREALQDLENALTFGGHDPQTWGSKGWLLLYKLKDYDSAARDLKRATELSPDHANYWYHYGAALSYKNDCAFVKAFERYQQLCEGGQGCRPAELAWARAVVARRISAGLCGR